MTILQSRTIFTAVVLLLLSSIGSAESQPMAQLSPADLVNQRFVYVELVVRENHASENHCSAQVIAAIGLKMGSARPAHINPAVPLLFGAGR